MAAIVATSLLSGSFASLAMANAPLNSPSKGKVNTGDLVLILVDQPIATKIADEVERYAADVQQTLPNTQTMISELPHDVAANEVFATLQKLYIEGYKSDNKIWKLRGIVLIGDIVLPSFITFQSFII